MKRQSFESLAVHDRFKLNGGVYCKMNNKFGISNCEEIESGDLQELECNTMVELVPLHVGLAPFKMGWSYMGNYVVTFGLPSAGSNYRQELWLRPEHKHVAQLLANADKMYELLKDIAEGQYSDGIPEYAKELLDEIQQA